MGARLVVRVRPDDHVEVEVLGVEEPRNETPPGEKLCEKVTQKLEQDLGRVASRVYRKGPEQQVSDTASLQRRDGEDVRA